MKIKVIILLSLISILTIDISLADTDISNISDSIIVTGKHNTVTKTYLSPSTGVGINFKYLTSMKEVIDAYKLTHAIPSIPLYKLDKKSNVVYPYFNFSHEEKDTGTYLKEYFSDGDLELLNINNDMDSLQFSKFFFLKGSPKLQILLTNNTNKTIVTDHVSFDVEYSKDYKKPIVYLASSRKYPGKILIKNDRRFKLYKISLKYNLMPRKTAFNNDYSFNAEYYFNNKSPLEEIDITRSLKYQGVNFEFFRNKIEKNCFYTKKSCIKNMTNVLQINKNLGIYSTRNDFNIHEKYEVSYYTYMKASYILIGYYHGKKYIKKGRLHGYIPFITSTVEEGGGGGPLPTFIYPNKVQLKKNQKKYLLKYPIARFMKPFEVERMLFDLDAESTSISKFNINMYFSNSQSKVSTKSHELLLYKPELPYFYKTFFKVSKQYKVKQSVGCGYLFSFNDSKAPYSSSIEIKEGSTVTLLGSIKDDFFSAVASVEYQGGKWMTSIDCLVRD